MNREPMNEPAPVTAVPAVTGADYLSRIARRTAWRLWWLVIPGIILVLTGFLYDLRISIVGFMLLLVVFPMVITTAVLGSATRPTVVARTRVDQVILDETGLALLDDKGNDIIFIKYSLLRSVRSGPRFVEIVFGKSPSDIIILPHSLLTDADVGRLARHARADEMMM